MKKMPVKKTLISLLNSSWKTNQTKGVSVSQAAVENWKDWLQKRGLVLFQWSEA